MMLFTIVSFAQTKIVSDVIIGADCQHISFSSIKTKNSKIGANDTDGNFFIRKKEGNVIIVPNAGISLKKATINGASSLNVSIIRNDVNIPEVVIIALGVECKLKAWLLFC